MQSRSLARVCSTVLLVLAAACGSNVAPPRVAPAPLVAPATAPPAVDRAHAVITAAPVPAPAPPATAATAAPTGQGRQARQRLAAVSAPPLHPTQPARIAWHPARLARQVLDAQRTLAAPESTERQLSGAGHTLQLAYRRLGNHRDLARQVIPRLPGWQRPLVRTNVRAHDELASLSATAPPKTLPEWRIARPAPRAELKGYYRKAQRVFGVHWSYLAAINLVETRMGRIKGTSTAGAQGPMQFILPTWRIYGRGDIRDDHDAIMAAGRYLRARGAPTDMRGALYSYNNDLRYVRAVAAYAEVMRRDPDAYRGYYHWQVYYRQPGGPVLLPVGYDGR